MEENMLSKSPSLIKTKGGAHIYFLPPRVYKKTRRGDVDGIEVIPM